jgi:hypothetical protein
MPPTSSIIGLIAIIVTIALSWRADRRSQQRRQENMLAAQQKQLQSILQDVVTKRLDSIFEILREHDGRLTEHDGQLTQVRLRHERLMGRLEGRGVLRHDQEDLPETGQ